MKQIFNILRNIIKRLMLFSANKRNIHFSLKSRLGRYLTLDASKDGVVDLGRCTLRDGCVVISRRNGAVILHGVSLNYRCIVVSYDRIEIGKGTVIGPNVCIYDHDHDFRARGGIHADAYTTAPVIIGKNVWIGAGCIILKGAHIGNNCVIAAGSVITGYVPDNSIFVQKRDSCIFPVTGDPI